MAPLASRWTRLAKALKGASVVPRNYRSAGVKCLEMIRVVLSDAAYDVIASTLPKGAARWPMQRDKGQCFIQVEAAVVDRMRAMRRPGESYSEVILKLVELKTSDPKKSCASRPTSPPLRWPTAAAFL
jgi:hypothetical protein